MECSISYFYGNLPPGTIGQARLKDTQDELASLAENNEMVGLGRFHTNVCTLMNFLKCAFFVARMLYVFVDFPTRYRVNIHHRVRQ